MERREFHKGNMVYVDLSSTQEIPLTPLCEMCGTWVGTHTMLDVNNEPVLVCDKPRCQDLAAGNCVTFRTGDGNAVS